MRALQSMGACLPSVAVVYGDETATGFVRAVDSTITFGDGGDGGRNESTLYVNAADLSEPEPGDRMTIGGSVVYVLGSSIDSVGAVRRIQYAQSRPATGLEGVQ